MGHTETSSDRSRKRLHCRVCEDTDSHEVFRVREMMFGSREEFEYFKCRSCGCLQITQIPDDLSRYYPKNYYSHQPATFVAREGYLRRKLEKLLIDTALFNRHHKLSRIAKVFASLPAHFFRARPNLLQRAGIRDYSARILDVGCGGQAQWLQDLKMAGFKSLLGIDPFITSDLTVNGIAIRCIDVQSFSNQSNDHFDIISLHHSLEHIPDQKGTLVAIRKLLAPSGICLIRVPIVSSLAWDIYGVDWVELDAPRHLYLHSKASLRNLGKAAGLTLFDIQYDTTEFEFYGSEQYRLNIPLTDPNSLWVNAESTVFPENKRREFQELAKQVNANGNAGRACFLFRLDG